MAHGNRAVDISGQRFGRLFVVGDAGSSALGLVLKDGALGYEPTNCRWATRREQNLNTNRSIGYRTLDGERISLRDMAAYLAIPETALYYRLRLSR